MASWWEENISGKLSDLAGGVSDITRFGNYQEALEDLEKLRDKEQKLKRVADLSKRLNSFDRSKIPQTREEEVDELNLDYFDMLSPEEMPKELTDYENYVKYAQGEGKEPASFDEYLGTLGKRESFMLERPTAYKKGKKQVPLTKEEQEQAWFTQAGLSPGDVSFFKEYEKESIGDYNKSLDEYYLEHGPRLRSMGSMGNTYEEDLKNRLSGMQLQEPEATKYSVTVDEKSGNLIYYNPLNPNDYRVVKYGEGVKKPEKNTIMKYANMSLDEAMSLPVPEMENAIFYFSDAVRAGLKKQFPKLQNIEDRAFNEGIYTKKTSSSSRRRSSGSSKGTDFSKWTTDKFAEIDADDLKKMTAGELKGLSNYSQYLNPDVQEALTTLVTEGNYRTSGNDDGSDIDMGDYADDFEKQLYEGADENEKEALDNVNKWFDDTVKAWGRADLTVDQWRDEIGQEMWTDLEFEIIKNLFRQKFGENY